jgi:hypothetical protein
MAVLTILQKSVNIKEVIIMVTLENLIVVGWGGYERPPTEPPPDPG